MMFFHALWASVLAALHGVGARARTARDRFRSSVRVLAGEVLRGVACGWGGRMEAGEESWARSVPFIWRYQKSEKIPENPNYRMGAMP